MSTITKELAKLFRKITNSEIDAEGNAHVVLSPADSLLINNARIALASLEAEPVAWDYELASYITCEGPQKFKHIIEREAPPEWAIDEVRARNIVPLYTAPPAPVSVPDAYIRDDRGRMILNGKQEPRIGYSAGWNACRAAMLQGAEPVTTDYKLPDNTPCKDAPEHIWLQTAGVWPENGEFSELTWCSDNQHPDDTLYVRADVVSGNSPVMPDGWIPVSGRMPEAEGRYWCYVEEQNCLGKSHYQWNCSWNGDRWWVESDNGGRVTHWMELPAAPQQEVKP